MYYIGIDHGKKGAIAVVDDSGDCVDFIDMPIIGNDLDLDVLYEFILKFNPIRLGIEEVTSIFRRMKGIDILTFGKNYGKLLGFFYAKEIPFELIHAKTWKKTYKLNNKPKECSVAEARQRWPKFKQNLPKTRDGRADAMLIAEHLRRTLK